MAGVWTIARKEFRDHVSDRAFLLCFAALLVTMAGGALFFTQRMCDITLRNSIVYSSSRGQGWKNYTPQITSWITGNLSSLGVLVAIALSFNSINKERTEGSLKVLLSYPIYRDKIILGKLLAGAAVISIVTVAAMVISFSIIVYYLAIPLTLDFLLRIAATTAIGIMLLSFFLCVGTAVSTVLRDTSTILLSLILIMSLLRFQIYGLIIVAVAKLASVFDIYIMGPMYSGREYYILSVEPAFRPYARFSPIETFIKLSERFFTYFNTGEVSSYSPSRYIEIPFKDHLFGNLDLVAVMFFFTVAAFIASYILFTRRDVA